MSTKSKAERLVLIYEFLDQASPCRSRDEVFDLLRQAFKEIEDLHSGVKGDPNAHEAKTTDGRMYAPHPEFVDETTDLYTVYKQAMHRTFIGHDGSFRIMKKVRKELVPEFEKPNANGKKYW